MAAFNVVRFRVKPGSEQKFIDAHRDMRPDLKGFVGASLVRTGDRTFCFVGEWRNYDSIVAARPQIIGMLDSVRDMLEDLGGGLGVTDPVSGDVALTLQTPKKALPKTKAKAKVTAVAKAKATPKTKSKAKARKK